MSSNILHFEAYDYVKKIEHPFLKVIWSCNQLDELIPFIMAADVNQRGDGTNSFIKDSICILNSPKTVVLYSHNDLLWAFTWSCQSRAFHWQLREHLMLPSVLTLQKITVVTKNKTDSSFSSSVFKSIEDRSKHYILIVDEIYVKASICYRRGEVFGYTLVTLEKWQQPFSV